MHYAACGTRVTVSDIRGGECGEGGALPQVSTLGRGERRAQIRQTIEKKRALGA